MVNHTLFLHGGLGRVSQAHGRSGTFYGASGDFWIVFAMSLVAFLGCFSLTFLRVEVSTRLRRKGDWEDMEPFAKPSRQGGCVERKIFKSSRYGTNFAFHADLALRGALVVLFCASTYGLGFLDWWLQQGWSMSYIVVIVAFTLYLDLGSTVVLAWTGFYGTLLPVLNCWLMFYFYPDGVKNDDTFSKIFGWIDFFVFVLLMFALGFATNAKMYALSWQAYFSMCFLNPFDTTFFSRGFGDVNLHAADTGALTGTIIGCMFAIFVATLPRHISALNKAQDLMLELTWSHGRLLEQLVEMGALIRPQAASVFAAEVQKLQQDLDQIKELKNSWWECFDLGVAGQSRLMLLEMCCSIDFLNDWCEAMVMAVQHAADGNDGNHRDLQPHILDNQRDVLQLIYTTKGAALQQSAAAAVKGDLDASTDECLGFWLTELEDFQVKAHEEVISRLLEKGSWQQSVTSTHLPQFALASSASGYSQKVGDLLLAMAEFDPTTQAIGPCRGFLQGLLDLPGAELQSWEALLGVLKLLLTFTTCFMLGWLGISLPSTSFVPPFNATAAGTVAYLIFQSGDQAAALKKNMDRFLGVASGSMLGTLSVGICGCLRSSLGWDGATVIFLSLYFCFEIMAFFVYFSSPNFSYAGLMFSCFYSIAALQPFEDLKTMEHFTASGGLQPGGVTADLKSEHQNILSQLLAIVVATLMDLLADKSLSLRATANLQSFIQLVDEAFDRYPLSTRAQPLELRKEGLIFLRTAAADGAEAAREPRCLGVPWRHELWCRVMKVCHEIWRFLTVVSITENPSSEQEKSLRSSVEILLTSRSFKQELQQLRQRSHRSFQLTMAFLQQSYYDETNPEMVALQEDLLQSRLPSADAAMPQILAELRTNLELDAAGRLLDNQVCAVAMFLMMFEALVNREAQLEAAILEQPEVWQLLDDEGLNRSEGSMESSSSEDRDEDSSPRP